MLDVAIVGAGPSGLMLAKQFAETKANFKLFERHSDVGGIWDIDAPNSPVYESAHFISSKTLSGFPNFPMPDDYPDYPSHKQLLAYIRSFADAFNLCQYIQFNTAINHAKRDAAGHWVLHCADGHLVEAKYLVCANGVTWNPNIVTWTGQETFTGEIRHSVTYRSPEELRGKRVLVIGAGNSGVDIACDASFAAEQAFLSVRRGYHFIPKHVMGKPADVFSEEGPKLPFWLEKKIFKGLLRLVNGDLTRYGLPKPDHDIFETHPIMNTQILHYLGHGDCIAKSDVECFDGDEVVFKDGSREKIDLVISATGYHQNVPYLEEGVLPYSGGRPELYMNIFSRQYDNLALLGFTEFASAAYTNYYKMAELIVADVILQPEKLHALKKSHQPDLRGKHHYLDVPRNANYVDGDTYNKVLAKIKQDLGLAA